MAKDETEKIDQKVSNRNLILDYSLVAEITGLVILSAFGFYAIRLVSSFRTGILAKSWKQVTVGAIFLILAQFPFLAAGIGSFGEGTLFSGLGMVMRFVGVLFLVIGLRAQSRVWRPGKSPSSATRSLAV